MESNPSIGWVFWKRITLTKHCLFHGECTSWSGQLMLDDEHPLEMDVDKWVKTIIHQPINPERVARYLYLHRIDSLCCSRCLWNTKAKSATWDKLLHRFVFSNVSSHNSRHRQFSLKTLISNSAFGTDNDSKMTKWRTDIGMHSLILECPKLVKCIRR